MIQNVIMAEERYLDRETSIGAKLIKIYLEFVICDLKKSLMFLLHATIHDHL